MSSLRPYQLPDGKMEYRMIHDCYCGKDRRGPGGGCCGNCVGAIPTGRPVKVRRVK